MHGRSAPGGEHGRLLLPLRRRLSLGRWLQRLRLPSRDVLPCACEQHNRRRLQLRGHCHAVWGTSMATVAASASCRRLHHGRILAAAAFVKQRPDQVPASRRHRLSRRLEHAPELRRQRRRALRVACGPPARRAACGQAQRQVIKHACASRQGRRLSPAAAQGYCGGGRQGRRAERLGGGGHPVWGALLVRQRPRLLRLQRHPPGETRPTGLRGGTTGRRQQQRGRRRVSSLGGRCPASWRVVCVAHTWQRCRVGHRHGKGNTGRDTHVSQKDSRPGGRLGNAWPHRAGRAWPAPRGWGTHAPASALSDATSSAWAAAWAAVRRPTGGSVQGRARVGTAAAELPAP